jgi:hypothetical protein
MQQGKLIQLKQMSYVPGPKIPGTLREKWVETKFPWGSESDTTGELWTIWDEVEYNRQLADPNCSCCGGSGIDSGSEEKRSAGNSDPDGDRLYEAYLRSGKFFNILTDGSIFDGDVEHKDIPLGSKIASREQVEEMLRRGRPVS